MSSDLVTELDLVTTSLNFNRITELQEVSIEHLHIENWLSQIGLVFKTLIFWTSLDTTIFTNNAPPNSYMIGPLL